MEKGDKLDKKFYKIRDVAEMLGLAQSTLRYWEQEFPQLRPRRNDGGTRFYTPDDIELLRIISFMVRDKGMRISAVRDQLVARGGETERRALAVARLRGIRDRIQQLLDGLSKRRIDSLTR